MSKVSPADPGSNLLTSAQAAQQSGLTVHGVRRWAVVFGIGEKVGRRWQFRSDALAALIATKGESYKRLPNQPKAGRTG